MADDMKSDWEAMMEMTYTHFVHEDLLISSSFYITSMFIKTYDDLA